MSPRTTCATARWHGAPYSVGTDEEIKFNPQRTTHLGQPVGENSSLGAGKATSGALGGGTTWGWFSYDPQLNLIYYGSGNPAHGTRRSGPATTSGR
jgi:glucose dehydrogenase